MKTLAEEHKLAKSAQWHDLAWELDQLAETYGWDAVGPWLVVRTAFHGGGQISHHRSAMRALTRARREGAADCSCGCAGVLLASEYDGLSYAEDQTSPYALAR